MRGSPPCPAELAAQCDWTADLARIRDVALWLHEQCAFFSVPADAVHRLDQCLNEVLENCVRHGGPGIHSQPLNISLRVKRQGTVQQASVTVEDAGLSFDPTIFELPERPATLDATVPGSLGVLIIRQYADFQTYRYAMQRNQFCFGVRWAEPSALTHLGEHRQS